MLFLVCVCCPHGVCSSGQARTEQTMPGLAIIYSLKYIKEKKKINVYRTEGALLNFNMCNYTTTNVSPMFNWH